MRGPVNRGKKRIKSDVKPTARQGKLEPLKLKRVAKAYEMMPDFLYKKNIYFSQLPRIPLILY